MPQPQDYRRFGSRYMLMNTLCMLPAIPVFIFIVTRASARQYDEWFIGAIVLFIALAVFGLWWQGHRARHMKCPQCQKQLDRSNAPAGTPITFICSVCDIEWRTGLSEAHD